MHNLNINLHKIESMNINKIKEEVKNWDTTNWLQQIHEKSTLNLFCKYKHAIQEITWFDNKIESQLMINARLDTLNLNWRNRNEETNCDMCDSDNEDLKHFLLYCKQYSDIGEEYTFMQQPYKEDTDEHLADILLFTTDNKDNKKIKERKSYLRQLWKERQRIKNIRATLTNTNTS